MSKTAKTIGLHGFWRQRYWLATKLIMLGMRVMPESRYRSELNAALWILNLKMQATVVAKRQEISDETS